MCSTLYSGPKKYITPKDFLQDSFVLAHDVFESGFKPTILISLWRGGAPTGLAITEYFVYRNCPIVNHCAPRASAYNHDTLKPVVEIFGLESVVSMIGLSDKVLIVDDVVDSGATIKAFLKALQDSCGESFPGLENIKVATIYYKPKKSKIKPDYYVHATDEWLVFPHELEGLTLEEITDNKGEVIAHCFNK